MKIKTKLFISYLSIVVLIVAAFLLWHLRNISVMRRMNTESALKNINSLLDGNEKLYESILAKYGKSFMELTEKNIGAQVLLGLKGVDPRDYYEAVRGDARIRKEIMQNLLAPDNHEVIGSFRLLDKDGTIVLCGDRTLEGRKYSELKDESPERRKIVERSFSEDPADGTYYLDGVNDESHRRYILLTHVPGTPFIVEGEVSIKDYYDFLNDEMKAKGRAARNDAEAAIQRSEDETTGLSICLGVIVGIFLIGVGAFTALSFSRRISEPITDLCDAVKRIGGGDFTAKVPIPSKSFTEIKELADEFNALGGELAGYVRKLKAEVTARQAIEGELSAGRKIQESLLPGRLSGAELETAGIDLDAVLRPAKNVSGDFYDYFFVNGWTLALLIADVSGKGIPAAIFMAVSRTLLRNICDREKGSPAEVLGAANRFLAKDNDMCMFVTVFLVFYNVRSGSFEYANAGHNPGMIFRPDGTHRSFGNFKNPPAGLNPEQVYSTGFEQLQPGETLVFSTDGITDANSPSGEFFGEDRLVATIRSNISSPVKKINEGIVSAVDSFQGENLFDDMTLLALRRIIS